MSWQTTLATFGPLVLGALLVAIGISGSLLKPKTKAGLEGMLDPALAVCLAAFTIWNTLEQRWGPAMVSVVLFAGRLWSMWSKRKALSRPKS